MNLVYSKIALLLIGLLSLVVVHPTQGARRTTKKHKWNRDLEESLSVDDVDLLWKENAWINEVTVNSMSMNMTDMRKYTHTAVALPAFSLE